VTVFSRARTLAVCLLVVDAGIRVAAQAPPPAAELAARVQNHYATVRDFTADFTLTQTSGLVKRGATDRGTVVIKKPNRMRWTFETGNHSQVVADGTRIYSYFPQDKYVQQTPLPKGDQASTALLFLAGRGDLTRDFTASLPSDQPPGEWHLRLEPKAPAEFTSLTLEVDRATYQLRGFTVTDDQGGMQHFRFSNLRENRGVADREFVFTIPKGVEVR
jgi:outer membrane lipoprotein carrier protein